MTMIKLLGMLTLILISGVALAQPPGNTEIRLKPSAVIGGVVVGDTLYTRLRMEETTRLVPRLFPAYGSTRLVSILRLISRARITFGQ